MGTTPIPVYSQFPGGNNSALGVTAAGVIKASPGVLYRALVSAAGSAGSLTFNDTATYVAAQTITAITAAANAVITVSTAQAANPFTVGGSIVVTGAVGMTQINGVVGTVTAIGGTSGAYTITTNINSTAFTAWASGGTAASFGASGAGGPGNQILTVAFGSLTIGQVITVEIQCKNGIVVSSQTTAGSVALTYF